MPAEPASKPGRVACVIYRSPTRWIMTAGFGLAALALLISAVRAFPYHPIDAGVMAALDVLIVWAMFLEAWLMETRLDGVYVRSTFGSSELIPYSTISRLVVRADRLQIHTGSKHSSQASIGLGFRRRGRADPSDALVAAIAQAAGLTRVSTSSLGWPTYDRE